MSVPIARRNLFHEKGKFTISILGTAAAISLILIIIGFRAGLYASVTSYVDNLGADLILAQSGVRGMYSSNSAIEAAIHDNAQSAVNATEASHIIVADVIFSIAAAKTPVVLIGYDTTSNFGGPWELGKGRLVDAPSEILLDTWLAKKSGVQLGDMVEILGQQFLVVGLTTGTSSWMSPYVFISIDAAEIALGLSGFVSFHLLRLPQGADLTAAAATIESEISGVDALTPDDISEADTRVVATIMDTPIQVLVFIGVVIGVAVMGLTAYTSVSDRMREYGVLKAVGASNIRLAWLVITETLYQSLFGFIVGIGLSYFLAEVIMALWPQFNILIQLQTIVQMIFLASVMTILAALLPVRRLNQVDPVIVFKS